jgi:hypothetical protein
LLDFDELQQGAEADGGSSGSGGEDASMQNPCGSGCPDDADPCTESECTPQGCIQRYGTGLTPDGLSGVLTAPSFHRVTMISRGERFYLSALQSDGTAYELVLSTFSKTDTEFPPGVAVSTLDDFGGLMPVSAAGLVSPAPGFNVVAYVAMGTSPSLPARVFRLAFDLNGGYLGNLPAAIDANYGGGRRVHPIAWQPPAGEVWGAWPGASGGVYLHTGQGAILTGEPPQMAPLAGQVFALAPLAAGNQPAVMWLTASSVNVQAVGQPLPVTLGQCDAQAGTFISATTAWTTLAGIYFGAWTKATPAPSVMTETAPIFCLDESGARGCIGSPTCGRDSDVTSGVRNIAMEFVDIDGDPAGRVYQVAATPTFDGSNPSNLEAILQLGVLEIDFDPTMPDAAANTRAVTAEPVEVARTPLASNGDGPDWPAVSVIPPDRVAVAWLQPSATGDELHVERFRLCLPR